jgi:hypothetical protein
MYQENKVDKRLILASSLALALLPAMAHAQASPTGVEAFRLSTFAGATGTYTGLGGGRNLGITAGVDLGIRSIFSLEPSLEVRGTYPFAKGQLDSQKDVLGGIKLAKRFYAFHPYVDLLYGRGQINYAGQGYLNPNRNFLYLQTAGNVLSPGVGVDLPIAPQFSLKADFQYQRWDTPAVASGHIYAKPLTVGLTYYFDFNRHHHY